MYAVIKTGGKQYRVSPGTKLRVERLEGEPGDTITFDQVLLVGEGSNVKLGTPFVEGSKVTATVVTQGRGKKINITKFKRRKGYLRQHGHRQHFTELNITDVA